MFICIHNSARSQMAEAFVNSLGKGAVKAESAGITPGRLNPYAVRVMKEESTDISGASTDGVMDYFNEGRRYDLVITVCSARDSGQCPSFPAAATRHWDIPDPSAAVGSDAEKLAFFRNVRNEIKSRVKGLLSGL